MNVLQSLNVKDYINYLMLIESRLTEGSMKMQNRTYNLCKEYQKKHKKEWDIETLNKSFYNDFINFLTQKKLLVKSTLQGHVKRLKAFVKENYPEHNVCYMKLMTSKQPDQNVIYLYDSELNILKNAVLHKFSFRKIRDLFLFYCYTEMRYCNSQRYNPSWEYDGTLEFRMLKTGGKTYPLLFDATKDILNEGGRLPKISDQKYNKYLKELFTHLGLTRQIPILEKRINPGGKGYKIVEVYRI